MRSLADLAVDDVHIDREQPAGVDRPDDRLDGTGASGKRVNVIEWEVRRKTLALQNAFDSLSARYVSNGLDTPDDTTTLAAGPPAEAARAEASIEATTA